MMNKIAISLIKAYKKILSPLLPDSCRYYPTCSEYALTAFERHGFIKALRLATSRILRCHPLAPGGYDPVK